MNQFLFELLQHIKKRVEKAVIADRPEHPWLYRNPDALIGYMGRLLAIFQPMKRERKNPDFLLARLLVARTALPKETICVVLDEAQYHPEGPLHIAYRNFHAILDPENALDSVLGILSDGISNSHIRPIQNDIQKSIDLVTSACLEVSEEFFVKVGGNSKRHYQDRTRLLELIESERFVPASTYSWTLSTSRGQRKKIQFKHLYSDRESEMGLSWIKSGVNPNFTTIANHCERVIRYEYEIDYGVPYGSKNFFTILVTDHLPERSHDPFLSIRTLARSRLCVISPSMISELDNIYEHMFAYLRGYQNVISSQSSNTNDENAY